jgi:DNA-binding MarR family transcriptional regulator
MEDERLSALGYRLGVLHRTYLSCVKDSMAKRGFPISLIPFLTELYFCDGITQDALSGLVKMDKGTTARAIARLERKGLVKRTENKNNRRQKFVYLTSEAKKKRETYYFPLYEMSRIMSKSFSMREYKHLLKSFALMQETLERELEHQRGKG